MQHLDLASLKYPVQGMKGRRVRKYMSNAHEVVCVHQIYFRFVRQCRADKLVALTTNGLHGMLFLLTFVFSIVRLDSDLTRYTCGIRSHVYWIGPCSKSAETLPMLIV